MFHTNHHLSLNRLLHSGMSKIYFFQAVQTFVSALIGIFIPLYMYSKGIGLEIIILFAVGVAFFKLVLQPFSIKFLNHAGFKGTIFTSLPIYVLYLYSLSFVELSVSHLIGSMFLGGLYTSIFWPAMHAEVAHKSMGNSSKIGNLQVVITLMSALAPLIGGYFLEFTSYELILLFSLILLGIGSIPLLLSEDIKFKKIHFTYKKELSFLTHKKFKDNLPFIGEGFETLLVLYIAPVLFFIWLKGNFASVGALLSLFSYLSIVFVVFFKSFIKTKSRHKSVKIVSKVSGIQWVFRAAAYTFGGVIVFVIEGLYKMISQAFYITYFSLFYNKENPNEMFDKIMQRETVISFSRILLGLFLAGLVVVLGESKELLIAFLFVGFFSSILKGFIADLN